MIAIEKQGQVVRVVNLTYSPQSPAKPTKRGNVTGFSRKSRRRLIDVFARLDVSGVRKTFLTLTFHGIPTPETAKAAFKRFLARLRYHYPQTCGVWRVELQERGAIHYHLILLDFPYVEQAILQNVWTECTGEDRSIVNVQLIRSHKGVMHYVSKYVAKVDKQEIDASLDNAPYQQNSIPLWQGRHWGYINEDCLPFAKRHVALIVDEEVANYFWWFASARLRHRDGTLGHTSRVYSADAQAIYQHALSLGGCQVDDIWHELLEHKALSPRTRRKASYFFAGINTHH